MDKKAFLAVTLGVVAISLNVTGLPTAVRTNTDPSQSLPDPDDHPAAIDKPVKVFILLGQSNMLGFGKVTPAETEGTLTHAVKTRKKYAHLVDGQGRWTQRQDVRYVQVMHRNGKMSTLRNEWLTVKGNVGPELQFGHIMGHLLDEPVLVLKSCIGNRSLGWDLLPPGSEAFEFEGKIYAGYRQSPLSWDKGTDPKPINWYAGKQYDDDVANVKKVLANIGAYYPGASDYEVAGFLWWQGHKDQNPAHAGRYEKNLVRLIHSLRRDFNAPQAKFVMATIAFGGWDLSGPGLTVAQAQLAVSGETGKYPAFKGNVKTVEARDYWRDRDVSPSGAGYHYNHNAETYMDVGNALGWAMADLLTDNRDSAQANAPQPERTLPEAFRKLEFGMFIHYNMATYQGVQWVEGYPSPAAFNPGNAVDTDAWAEAAVRAGMTYGVLTAKHVGGFCLWDSEHTTYDVMHPECPYQQDLVAQFIASFKRRGLKAGLYYCWRHPGFDTGKNEGKFKVLPPECDPAKHALEAQIEFQKQQITELIEKYPDVFYLWNDALDPGIMPREASRAFIEGLRRHRPDLIASSNWWDWGLKGTPFLDIAVKEMRHFPETNTVPGETCWKLEQGWFWTGTGASTQNTEAIMQQMTAARSRNSNFLLNVGPDRTGSIIPSSIQALEDIGKWCNSNTGLQPSK